MQKEEKGGQKQQPNLNDALGDFNEDNKLNITDGDDDNEDILDPKVQEEFDKLINAFGGGDDSGAGLSGLMESLLSGIAQQGGDTQGTGPTSKEEQEFKSKMGDLLKGLEGGNIQDVANTLLHQLMGKDILQQPLKDGKRIYEQIFADPGKTKSSPDDLDRYRKQYLTMNQILVLLQKDPSNKEALIKKFEEMQEYGALPEGINLKM